MLRRPAWLRWLLVPWSELTLISALVFAAASPALLLTASDVWDTSAADRVTAGVTAETTAARVGVDVSMAVVFSGSDLMARAEQVVANRLSEVHNLGESTTTFFSLVGRVTARGDPSTAESARLMARSGAADAIRIIEHDTSYEDGVLISSWLAEQTASTVGSTIDFEAEALLYLHEIDHQPGIGVMTSFTVSGIYEPLWSPQKLDLPAYWDDVDPALIPRYLGPFRAPNFELLITDQTTLTRSGGPGVVQWVAPVEEVPSTYRDLQRLSGEYQSLETSFVRDGALSAAVGDLAGLAPRNLRIDTGLRDTVEVIDDAIAQLDQPLALVRGVAVIVGLLVMAAVGMFLVDRRRTEFRLLSSEGERWWQIWGRLAAQLVAPIAAGSALGMFAGVLTARTFGPADVLEWGSIRLDSLTLFALAAVAIASLVVGLAAERTLDQESRRGSLPVVPLLTLGAIGATVFLWNDVSRSSSTGVDEVDLAVVALPVVGLVAAVLLTVFVLRRGVIFLLRWRSRLPLDALFALRRTASGERAMHLVGGALGFGVGMVIFSFILVDSLDSTIDVKLATEIGGETRLDLFGPVGADLDLPDGSTVLAVQDTRLTPGQQRVRVVAIDAESFEGAVEWPEEFGSSAGEVVQLLQDDAGDALPVVAVGKGSVVPNGAFGATNPIPFEVVDFSRSAPLAAEVGATLLVDGARLDEFELQRVAAVLGAAPDDPGVLQQYRRPTDSYRRHVITDQSRASLEPVIEAAGMGVRSGLTREVRTADADIVAARAVFEYLGLLGYVTSAVAVASLMLHLSARRRSTALASVMLRRMGLRPRRAARISVFEIATLTTVVAVTAVVAAFFLTRQVAGRFDPAPRLPPEVSVQFPYLWGPVVVVAATLTTGVVAYLAEASSRRRSDSGAVRDGA